MGNFSIILFGVLFFACPGPCGWDRQWLLGGNAGANENWGAIAQLGERYNGIVEVVGSIPIGSTTFKNFFFKYRLRGARTFLGRRVLSQV